MFFNFLTFKSSYSVPDDILYMDNFFFFNHPCLQMKKWGTQRLSIHLRTSADECIRKLWYIYTMEYYSAIKKNTFESVPIRWIKLEPIIQSEVSQKGKHQYSILTHIYGIQKDGNDNPICEIAKETQMYRSVFWTLWERARVGWLGRMALKHVYYHMWSASQVQVQCMRQGTSDCCTGMTQRDGMGSEVGGRFRMGNTCTSVVDSCQCMAKHYNIVE